MPKIKEVRKLKAEDATPGMINFDLEGRWGSKRHGKKLSLALEHKGMVPLEAEQRRGVYFIHLTKNHTT